MPGTMLREVQNVRQIGGDPSRRWFSDPGMDLIVWMEARDIVGFQLTYDKPHAEKAVTWRAGAPELSYTGVDDGEGRMGKYKSTPILVADGILEDTWHLCGQFLRRCSAGSDVPIAVREFVSRKLTGASGNVRT